MKKGKLHYFSISKGRIRFFNEECIERILSGDYQFGEEKRNLGRAIGLGLDFIINPNSIIPRRILKKARFSQTRVLKVMCDETSFYLTE